MLVSVVATSWHVVDIVGSRRGSHTTATQFGSSFHMVCILSLHIPSGSDTPSLYIPSGVVLLKVYTSLWG